MDFAHFTSLYCSSPLERSCGPSTHETCASWPFYHGHLSAIGPRVSDASRIPVLSPLPPVFLWTVYPCSPTPRGFCWWSNFSNHNFSFPFPDAPIFSSALIYWQTQCQVSTVFFFFSKIACELYSSFTTMKKRYWVIRSTAHFTRLLSEPCLKKRVYLKLINPVSVGIHEYRIYLKELR